MYLLRPRRDSYGQAFSRGVLCVGPLSSCWSTGVLTVRASGELY